MMYLLAFLAGVVLAALAWLWWHKHQTRRANQRARLRYWAMHAAAGVAA